jgi:glycosyltransferase involved in cell wall biosynthesis
VTFAGHYGAAEGLGVFYKLADVYVCMSEHEGFCIPLVEAMHYNVPVLAYASSGMPFTLGQAGVLFNRKYHPVIAEMAEEVISNQALRQQLIAGQRTRLADFAPDRSRAQFRATLEMLANL